MISAFISVIFVLIAILLVGGVLVAALISVAEAVPRRKLEAPIRAMGSAKSAAPPHLRCHRTACVGCVVGWR
jgi:hypothetical protein